MIDPNDTSVPAQLSQVIYRVGKVEDEFKEFKVTSEARERAYNEEKTKDRIEMALLKEKVEGIREQNKEHSKQYMEALSSISAQIAKMQEKHEIESTKLSSRLSPFLSFFDGDNPKEFMDDIQEMRRSHLQDKINKAETKKAIKDNAIRLGLMAMGTVLLLGVGTYFGIRTVEQKYEVTK